VAVTIYKLDQIYVIKCLNLGMEKERSEDIIRLCKYIDKLRCERGLTMREFAEKCNIHKSQVNELTKSGVDFRYSTLVNIANGLGITVSKLVNIK